MVSTSRSGSGRAAQRGGGGAALPVSPRVSTPASSASQRRWWASLERVALAFCAASVALALSCALYLYVFRHPVGRGQAVAGFVGEDVVGTCDVFDGGWVPDEAYPLYNSSECPFAEQGFDCLAERLGRHIARGRGPLFDLHAQCLSQHRVF